MYYLLMPHAVPRALSLSLCFTDGATHIVVAVRSKHSACAHTQLSLFPKLSYKTSHNLTFLLLSRGRPFPCASLPNAPPMRVTSIRFLEHISGSEMQWLVIMWNCSLVVTQ